MNKQYSKEDYEKLVPRIIEHMQKTGEWGESFPISLAIFPYNDTLAQDYYPLSKEEVIARGWKWQDPEETNSKYLGAIASPPDNIQDATESVCSQIFICEASGKHFKIIPQEFKLYQKMQIPLPRKSFFERHRENLKMRNPRKVWERKCDKCGMMMQTSYATGRPEKVYCEGCYLKEVY
ncbi:MAG: hypothetical protein ACHQVK_02990 [Candidatus Paceibacterales bacterium]